MDGEVLGFVGHRTAERSRALLFQIAGVAQVQGKRVRIGHGLRESRESFRRFMRDDAVICQQAVVCEEELLRVPIRTHYSVHNNTLRKTKQSMIVMSCSPSEELSSWKPGTNSKNNCRDSTNPGNLVTMKAAILRIITLGQCTLPWWFAE